MQKNKINSTIGTDNFGDILLKINDVFQHKHPAETHLKARRDTHRPFNYRRQ